MWRLIINNLRTQRRRISLTAFAIGLGVAMIYATLIALSAAEASSNAARRESLRGADLIISSLTNSPIPLEALSAQLAEAPEVATFAPLLRQAEGQISAANNGMPAIVSSLEGSGLILVGIDPANNLLAEQLSAGRPLEPADQNAILLPADWASARGLFVGDQISLSLGSQRIEFSIVGLLQAERALLASSDPEARLPLSTMQAAFAMPDQATQILVNLQPGLNAETGRAALQTQLGSAYVVGGSGGDNRSADLFTIFVDSALPFASFAVIASGAFLVYNAFAITLAERRRELAQLRAIGATRRQIFALVIGEGLLIALVGGLLALPVGWLIGRGLVVLIIDLLRNQPLPTLQPDLTPALIALGCGLLTTLLTTLNLAAEAAKTSPLAALRAEAPSDEAKRGFLRWSWLPALGLLAIAGWLVGQFITPAPGQSYDFVLLGLPAALTALASILLLPLASRSLIALMRPLFERLGVPGRLAYDGITQRPLRTTLTAATMCVGILLVIALSGMMGTLRTFQETGITPLFRGDYLLVNQLRGVGFSELGRSPSAPPISAALKRELAALGEEATIIRQANILLPGYGAAPQLENGFAYDLAVYRDNPQFSISAGSWEQTDATIAAGGEPLILPELSAGRLGLQIGDRVELETLAGRVPFTLTMIGGLLPTIRAEAGERYFGAHPLVILISAKPGIERAELGTSVRRIAERHNLIFVDDPVGFFRGALDSVFLVILGLFNGLTSLSALVGGLGVATTLAAAILERQRELGTLRALGATQGQIRTAISLEAAAIGVVGAWWGALGGLVASVVFSLGNITFSKQLGVPNLPLSVPWGLALVAMIIGPALAALVALGPAARAAAINPAEAMRSEGSLSQARPRGPYGMRAFLARMPLAARLAITLSLVFIASVTALTIQRARAEQRLLEQNLIGYFERQGSGLLGLIRDQLPDGITDLSPATLQRLRDEFETQFDNAGFSFNVGNDPYEFGLVYYLLADTELRVLDSDRSEWLGRELGGELRLPLAGELTMERSEWSGEPAYQVVVPLERSDGALLGYTAIGVSTDPIDGLIAEILVNSLWATTAALLVALIFTWRITRQALSPLDLIVEASRAVANGDLTRQIPEDRYDEIGRLARAFNDMVRGLNERERLRDLFGRYLSREVGEAVLAGKVTLGGERREASVLFCDMRGSTPFAEAHSPEEVMGALNHYFDVVIRAVESEGGIVSRFLGDGALCLFGAPSRQPDHATRAVAAALHIRHAIADLNRRRSALGQPILTFGMGINSGEVTAGATGSERRQEYTIIGDTVNSASRIEGLTRTYPEHDLLIGAATLGAINLSVMGWQAIDLGEHTLRGRSAPLRIFAIEEQHP